MPLHDPDEYESEEEHLANCRNPVCPVGKTMPTAVQWEVHGMGIDITAVITGGVVVAGESSMVIGVVQMPAVVVGDEALEHIVWLTEYFNEWLKSQNVRLTAEVDQITAGIEDHMKGHQP